MDHRKGPFGPVVPANLLRSVTGPSDFRRPTEKQRWEAEHESRSEAFVSRGSCSVKAGKSKTILSS